MHRLTKSIQIFLLLFLFSALSVQAHAQSIEDRLGIESDETIDDLANRYYAECLISHKNMGELPADAQCGCTAYGIAKQMDLSQAKALFRDDEVSKQVQSKLLHEIYIPCTGPTVSLYLEQSCYLNDGPTPEKLDQICQCISGVMSEYAVVMGDFIIGDKRNPRLERYVQANPNPVSALMSSSEFRRRSQYVTKTCTQKYTIWRENFR